MGLFQNLFGGQKGTVTAERVGQTSFETLTAYKPAFKTYNGALYESELVRAAIDSRARHISKLRVELVGAAQPRLQSRMRIRPNPYQTWSQFLYRTSTILDMQNTCFIIPVTNQYGDQIGYYPVLPSQCSIVDYQNKAWLRYQFSTGKVGAIEASRCGILTKFQYKDDFFGETNKALNSTLSLIDMQNQGIEEGIKSAAAFRFMARLTNFKSPDDLAAEQKEFNRKNFSADAGGMLLFPNTYDDIKQIESKPFTVDAEQMKIIQTNVHDYFGVNVDIVQNRAVGEQMDAFFEGAIEPFAIQLSEVLTNMTFNAHEQAYGAEVLVTANRLQYMTTSEKVSLVKELGDRGFITINEARELLNYSPLPDGDKSPIRGEFYFVEDGKNEKPSDAEEAPQEETMEQEEE